MKKRGVYDKYGNEIIAPNKYDDICLHELEDGGIYYSVICDGKYGACDATGKEIIPCDYKWVFYSSMVGFNYENSEGKYIPLGIKLDSSGRAYQSK